jgi:2-polyprenyl-3-methyl-5-hydroxy-6-metoxy-1,4-benzoquinol methylase
LPVAKEYRTLNLAERANHGLHAHVLYQVALLGLPPKARIVDVGCGSGAMLEKLAAAGFESLFGIDIAPPASSSAAIRYVACDLDAPSTPWPAASMDLILSVEVLEHVENIGALLAELARLLAPGGLLLLTTPNVHSIEARLRFLMLGRLKQFDDIGDPTHVYPLFRFPFERLLQRHGFEVSRVWGFPEDGRSPTSRPGLRAMARMLRLFGLSGEPAGDQLCYLLRRPENQDGGSPHDKRTALTAHYQRTQALA